MSERFTEESLRAMNLVWCEDKQAHIKIKTIAKITSSSTTKIADILPKHHSVADTPYKKPTHEEVILEIHNRDSVNNKSLVFEWKDKHISLNEWYSSKHWSNRNKIAKEWHLFFKKFLIKPYQKFDKYIITLKFNSRLDPSNTITLLKLCEDMMQKEKIILNDNKDNCKGLYIIPDMTMKKFSYKIIVSQWT